MPEHHLFVLRPVPAPRGTFARISGRRRLRSPAFRRVFTGVVGRLASARHRGGQGTGGAARLPRRAVSSATGLRPASGAASYPTTSGPMSFIRDAATSGSPRRGEAAPVSTPSRHQEASRASCDVTVARPSATLPGTWVSSTSWPSETAWSGRAGAPHRSWSTTPMLGRASAARRRCGRPDSSGQRVDSVPETALRLLMVLAGLPEPAGGHPYPMTPTESIRYRIDLGFEGVRLAIEYDGRWHDTDEQREARRGQARRAQHR